MLFHALPIDVVITHPLAIAQMTQQPIQPRSNRLDQISINLEVIFVLFLFMSYIGITLGYKKHCKQRAGTRLQQIQTLERIWNMSFTRR